MYSSIAIYKLKNGLKKDLESREGRNSNRSSLLPFGFLKRLTSQKKQDGKHNR